MDEKLVDEKLINENPKTCFLYFDTYHYIIIT